MGLQKLAWRIIDLILVCFFYLVVGLTRIFPVWFCYFFVEVVGIAIYYAMPRMRKDLMAKISDAMPEVKDRRELSRIGRGACTSMLMPVLEGMLFWRRSDEILKELEIVGMEHFDRADSEGKGLLVYSIHHPATIMQSYMILAALGRGYPIVAWDPGMIPAPRYGHKMEKLMTAHPTMPPVRVILAGHGHDAFEPMSEQIAARGRLGLVVDVPGDRPVKLLGRPAAMADGIGRLSCKYGAPIVPVILHRKGRGLKRKLVIYEPIKCEHTGEIERDINSTMEKVFAAAEKMIRQSPGEWMCWFGIWHWWEKGQRLLSGKEETQMIT